MSSSEYSFSGDDDDGAASSSSEEVIPTTKRRFGGINSDDDDGEEEEAGKSNVGKGIIEDGKKEEQQNKRQKKGQLAASVPVVFPKKLPTTFLMQVDTDMDLKGDCATIGLVRVDEKDKKTPLTMDLKGIIFRGAPLHCNTFAVVDISTISAKEAAKQAEAKAKQMGKDGGGGGGGSGSAASPEVPASRQQAKVTHLINGFFNMERLATAETEVVSQGSLDDPQEWKTSEDVVGEKTAPVKSAGRTKKKTTKKKSTKGKR